ncbi:hypothetical protein VHEMI05773 [[Torrubiella] hemipterigena]|uniref:Glutamine amidotransferase domain-containing protein n=1 Tax=[Torrubiella] hemipterigena TaxID=1531966 RepID=A0A0A1THT2_9HYPO|nr:hypothetical protein VHEMI05773 [[Torrubiella] hemipterigena]
MHVFRRFIAVLSGLVVLILLYRMHTAPAVPLTRTPPAKQEPGTMAPIRLAIIEADTPQPKANEKFGGYRGLYTEMLRKAAEILEPPQPLEEVLKITGHHVVDDKDPYPNLDNIDAILISGSKHTAYHDDAWILNLVEFTKKALATKRVKVIGVCFGHQLLARVLGAPVVKNKKGWEVSVMPIHCTDKGKEIFGRDILNIEQMYSDIVYEVPEGSTVLASNDMCPIQALYSEGSYISIQGHPEFTGEIMDEILTNRRGVLFTDEMSDDGMRRAHLEQDGAIIAKGFIRFLRQG